ncbi:MAG: glycosyltransferase [Acutalibacteraceae bacterium]|nr:glycosyltransferase [Acutalibacteraceae bacterium]
MRFSIILPIYNVEKYLKECVDSILKQTFRDYEIILVDDGSTDGSPELCDKLAETYDFIRVIHKANGGAADSRNVGLKSAIGDYILFIDSDDFILSEHFLEDVNNSFSENVDMVLYKYSKFFDDTKNLAECNFSYESAKLKENYADKIYELVKADAFFGMAWIRAIRKDIILDNQIFFETGLTGEDMDWNYELMLNVSNIELLDNIYIAYRQRSGSVTASYKIKNLEDFIHIVEVWSEKLRFIENDTLKKALLGSLAKNYSNLLIVYSRLTDINKKEYKQRIKKLDWLLKYGMSKRPQTVAKIYRIFGFNLTVSALKILDKIKH